jgi:GNAT superfamily N-acetyltransferase
MANPSILLVNPPVISPATPPWTLIQAAAWLDTVKEEVELYDANLDFFCNRIFDSKSLLQSLERIKKRNQAHLFAGADRSTAALLADLTANPVRWEKRIADARRILELLKSNDFFEPAAAVKTLEETEALLALSSAAFYPSRIEWAAFYSAAISSRKKLAEFIENSDSNPFVSFSREALDIKLGPRGPEQMVLCVSAAAQVPAALTIASVGKQRRPALRVALLSDERKWLKEAEGLVDNLQATIQPVSFRKLLGVPPESAGSAELKAAALERLPLKEYLAPALVLPVGRPAAGEGCWRFTQKQTEAVGIQGFLPDEDGLQFAEVNKAEYKKGETRPAWSLGINCPLDGSLEPPQMAAVSEAGVRMIRWHRPQGALQKLRALLWSASEAGIWNRIVFPADSADEQVDALAKWAVSNPNIAHSWEYAGTGPLTANSSGQPGAYGRVPPLPGRPLWSRLSDPAHLLLYLNKHGNRKVMHWRFLEDGREVYSVGRNLEYYFVPPGELPPGHLDEICRMVEAGGSVGTRWVRHNLERAYLIGYVMERGTIVANSSLKHPREEYVQKVSRQSGLDLREYLERGYTSVRPEYRGMGIGTKLLEGLTAKIGDKKLFSVIGADNLATQKIALRNRTREVASFYSRALGKQVGVWIPEWMLEE